MERRGNSIRRKRPREKCQPATANGKFRYAAVVCRFLDSIRIRRARRMKKVTAPDATTVETSYQGARTVQRSVKIATSGAPAGGSAAITTETFDRQGRLTQVAEPIGTLTQYGYDVGNRLSSVLMTSGTTTQSRTFAYDNRGFLVSEKHPESGTTHWTYDSRGHAHTKELLQLIDDTLVGDARYDERFYYDAAEHLIRITSRATWVQVQNAPFVD